MKRCDIEENIGNFCTVNGYGDLAFESEMKPLIYRKTQVKIIKITKSGLIQVQDQANRKYYSLSQRNLDLVLSTVNP